MILTLMDTWLFFRRFIIWHFSYSTNDDNDKLNPTSLQEQSSLLLSFSFKVHGYLEGISKSILAVFLTNASRKA